MPGNGLVANFINTLRPVLPDLEAGHWLHHVRNSSPKQPKICPDLGITSPSAGVGVRLFSSGVSIKLRFEEGQEVPPDLDKTKGIGLQMRGAKS